MYLSGDTVAGECDGDLAAAEQRLDDPVTRFLLGIPVHLEGASLTCARLTGATLRGAQPAGASILRCTAC
jgi:hypothetical protein